MVSSVWYWYCAIRWYFTYMWMHSRASVKGILSLPKAFKRATMRTGTVMCRSAFISGPLNFVKMSIWLVESSKARIWRYHHPEQVEFVDPGMLFEEIHYGTKQLITHTESDSMKIIRYGSSHWGNAYQIPEYAVWGSGHLIIETLSCFTSLLLISLSRQYHLLDV